MASLPKAWKLKTRKNKEGKLEVVGKDDLGKPYVARTCPTGDLTESDVAALARGNRETSSARELVAHFEKQKADHDREWRENMLDDFMEPSERVVHAGLHLSEARVGYSPSYARNWERAFGKEK